MSTDLPIMRRFPFLHSLCAVLFLLVLCTTVFHEAIFPPVPGWVLSRPEGDVGTLYYYWRAFGFGEMGKGSLPLWNPFVLCGTPFAAYPESALFYPPNLIFLALPVAAAISLSFVLHLFLLAVFQYLFLKKLGLGGLPALLGASALALSAPVVLHIHAGHLSNVCALSWVPLVFLALEDFLRRRRLLSAALAGALCGLQLLSGHAQYVYYTVLLGGIYLLLSPVLDFSSWRGKIPSWAAGAALFLLFAAGISAVQSWPAAEVSRESFRKSADIAWSANFSLPPLNLLTLVFPDALGDSVRSLYWGQYYFWEMCAYLGIAPLLLALAGIVLRRDRMVVRFFLLALVAVVLALGAYTPIFPFLHRFLPGFSLLRGSAKLLFFAVFSLSVLSAAGAETLRSRRGKKVVLRSMAVICALVFLASSAFLSASPRDSPAWWKAWTRETLTAGRHYDIVVPGQPDWWKKLMAETPPERNYPVFTRRLVEESPFAASSWALFRESLLRLGLVSLALAAIFFIAVPLARPPVHRTGLQAATGPGQVVGPLPACAPGAPAGKCERAFGRRLAEAAYIRLARLIPLALLVLTLVELIPWARRFSSGFDTSPLSWPAGEAEFFRSRTDPYRYSSLDPGDFNRGMLASFPCLLGYQADASRRFLEYVSVSQGTGMRPDELLPLIERPSPLLDLLNWRYVIGPEGSIREESGFRKVFAGGKREIGESARARPRALISGGEKIVHRREAVFPELLRAGYDPREYIVLEERPEGTGAGGAGTARLVEGGTGDVVVEASLSAPGWLLLADAFAPGWEASVDGKESRIYRANYLLRAVFLDAGRHRVVFSYRPLSFAVGGAVSAISLIALAVWSLRAARRSRRSPGLG